MSGRAYARNPSGAFGGATDIHSYVPHRFRLAAPKVTNKAKDQAIRRVIQRRCKEKNWKKLLRMQHTRLFPLQTPEEEAMAAGNGAENGVSDSGNAASEEDNGAVDNSSEKASNQATQTTEAANGDSSEATAGQKKEAEAAPVPVVDVKQQEKEALEKAKQQLQEMEEKLKTLSAQKHEKFQQLKDLLIAEARSKATPPMPKKRRVDSLGSSSGTSSSPRLTGMSIAEGTSLLGAPSPNLLRAQSFSVSSSHDFAAQDPHGKDARR